MDSLFQLKNGGDVHQDRWKILGIGSINKTTTENKPLFISFRVKIIWITLAKYL